MHQYLDHADHIIAGVVGIGAGTYAITKGVKFISRRVMAGMRGIVRFELVMNQILDEFSNNGGSTMRDRVDTVEHEIKNVRASLRMLIIHLVPSTEARAPIIDELDREPDDEPLPPTDLAA